VLWLRGWLLRARRRPSLYTFSSLHQSIALPSSSPSRHRHAIGSREQDLRSLRSLVSLHGVGAVSGTTGIRAFAECRRLCWVLFIGHSAKTTLPSAALGKVLRSIKILFTECRTLGTAKHSAKTALPRVKHSTKMALGKGSLAAVYSWRPLVFAECQIFGTRQRTLCRVSSLDTRQSIFLFFYFVSQTFCGMLLHYVDLYVSFVDNYNRVFNR
jgi:hypothetical protein